MTLSIGELEMSSPLTWHRAVRPWESVDRWFVSWLGNRPALTRNEAVTAMSLAEIVAAAAQPMPADTWVLITDLAGELGLGPDEAMALILAPEQEEGQR